MDTSGSNVLSDDLCERCRNICFRSLFHGSGEHDDYFTKETKLGTLQEIWSETSCLFCQLVKYTLENHFKKNSVEVVLLKEAATAIFMYWGPLDEAHDDLKISTRDIPYYIDFGVYSLERSTKTDGSTIYSNPQVIALRDSDRMESNPSIHFGRTVNSGKVDWSMINDWLVSCSSTHIVNRPANSNHNSPHQEDQSKLRVIDVSKACIVTLPPKARYIALSYVWGKDQALKLKKNNETSLSTAGCFDRKEFHPSRTIIDAIQVVRHLGYLYLWVDALCIVQDDSENKQANIERMGQIYNEALLTIVAAAGTHADHGLPGVSPECQRSPRQKTVTIQGITMANRFYSNINSTYWNKRGWTYQERILSPRILAFTPSHITYNCDEGCDHDEQFYAAYDGARFTPFYNASKLDFESNNIFDVYAFAVSEYTKRSINDPMDKIKAFKGALELLQKPFKGPFFFGLPVSMFDVGLLWIPVGPCSRGNTSFPSWSWAGWEGAVAYDYIEADTLTNLCECTVSQCSIKTSDTDIDLCYSSMPRTHDDTLIKDQNWTRHFDLETCEIYYRASEEELQSYRYPRPLSAIGREASHHLSKDLGQILQIRGRVAKFHLTRQHSGASSIASSCRSGHNGQCNLAILDSKNRTVGRVLIDARTLPELQNREHRFLALSRSTLYSNDEDISWEEDSKTFRSWVGAPASDEDGLHKVEYEEYHRPFARRIADSSSEIGDGDSVLPEPAAKMDRASIFRKDYNGPQENRGPFDARYFSNKVFWPLFNVLLLSEEKNGVVERCGIGQIHVDAFRANDKEEKVLLG
ncbi:heterokaryon incompatibility protein-domain-containing protein [Annulohypoxylon maeteangense]|uniref:heterokaryon incompatibility protein-domain-containing protein n=1 Tax=Annulohypoxylon maeteangense TaxID=1927788 RepID=UPI002007F7B0|nr:heterokaryon incompatibility protein-domain-containing protein [Annulohypoxylon maeteangense]KAI0883787.1 heterokaryon incompatibility protein-domain-containing protein [Annulohypoxylon maeteangense]